MSGGYGPPLLNFEPLANLGKTFLDARKDAREQQRTEQTQATLASLGEGKADYDTVGRKLLALGELNGGLGFLKLAQEEKLRGAQTAADRDALSLAYGGGGPSSPAYAPTSGGEASPISAQMEERARTVYNGLIQRGLSPTAAAGIVGNLQGESSLLPGSGGDRDANGQASSFGYAQWRGDRFTALKQLAASQGKDWRDSDVQLDHLVNELKGPEARAHAALQSAKTPEEAAEAFMRLYERPAEWAMRKSGPVRTAAAAQYFNKFGQAQTASASAPQQGPVQVASADPNGLILPPPPTGPVTAARPVSIETTPPQQTAQRAVPGQGDARSQLISNLERGLTNPNLSDGMRRAMQSRLEREYKLQDESTKANRDRYDVKMSRDGQVTAIWDKNENRLLTPAEMQQRGIVPQQAGQGGMFSGNSVEAQALNHLVKTGILTEQQAAEAAAGKTITDPSTGQILFMGPSALVGGRPGGPQPQPVPQQAPQPAPTVPNPFTPPTATAVPDQAQPPAPTPAPVAPDPQRPGVTALTPPKAAGAGTEDQNKNRQLYGQTLPQLQIAEQNFDALSRLGEGVGSKLPLGAFLTSEEYQRAFNATSEIVANYLYSVSGATATDVEIANRTRLLIPQPGEKPGTIADKKARLRAMVDGIKTRAAYAPGTEPQSTQQPPADDGGWISGPNGVRIREKRS